MIPFVQFEIQLHNCVFNSATLQQELEEWLKTKLEPVYPHSVHVEKTGEANC